MSNAWIAFLFHGPGLRLLRGYRMPRWLLAVNAAAIGLTFVCAGIAFFELRQTAAAITIWLAGHFGWSIFLAWFVGRERAPR